MTLAERIAALSALGQAILDGDDYLEATIARTAIHNPWFTAAYQRQALDAIATGMLDEQALNGWVAAYDLPPHQWPRNIGLVMAGNLPLVGFHDVLCVFVAGHKGLIKLSEKDPYLLPALLRMLTHIAPRTADYFEVVERLAGFDAVIATGSNNSARYFQAYFSKYPHIIRSNRNAVAVLSGHETPQELLALGRDVFDYFGLGCRSVSKLYLPEGYDFEPLLEALYAYRDIVNHTKYKNNFDYNYALYLLNKVEFQSNGCILIRQDASLQSAIATLHYDYYTDPDHVAAMLLAQQTDIQLVVSHRPLPGIAAFAPGQAQRPTLYDYADGVDTMAFLRGVG